MSSQRSQKISKDLKMIKDVFNNNHMIYRDPCVAGIFHLLGRPKSCSRVFYRTLAELVDDSRYIVAGLFHQGTCATVMAHSLPVFMVCDSPQEMVSSVSRVLVYRAVYRGV